MGFGGAFISLLISKPMAKWTTRLQIINASPAHARAGSWPRSIALRRRPASSTPEVGIYEGAPNAFATGAFKNSALVAVSTGLLQSDDPRRGRSRDRPRGGSRRQR
jgi:heat shock protein HtpX